MRLFLKCSEAAQVCDKSQYKEAGFWEKFALKIHLAMCRLCCDYATQNTKLTHSIKSAKIKILCPEEKQRLKTKLNQEFHKGSSF